MIIVIDGYFDDDSNSLILIEFLHLLHVTRLFDVRQIGFQML